MIKNKLLSALLILVLTTTGCATARTVTRLTKESPKVYSGTRLDIQAISKKEDVFQRYNDKFGVAPPKYPKLDLPFSFLLDTLLIPVVLPVALYDLVFE